MSPITIGGLVLCATPAIAETPAGTAIVNVGRLTYTDQAGHGVAVDSNAQRTIVAERLDVALAGAAATPSDGDVIASATLTNTGNGREAFAISATASMGDDRIVRLAVDGDGDGRYDPAVDAAIRDRTAELLPGRSVALFVILRPATVGSVTLNAAAITGSGAAGTSFPAAGDGGGDAVVGATGARATVTLPLDAPPAAAATLTKSAVVLAQDGSSRGERDATITYTLVARFAGAAETARISDPIPAGTTYAPGSLTLDGVSLSDAIDGDAGEVASGRVTVALGTPRAGTTRTVRFNVIIE